MASPLIAVAVFLFFSRLRLREGAGLLLVRRFSSLTLGAYAVHLMILNFLNNIVACHSLIAQGLGTGLLQAGLVFVLSYGVAALMARIRLLRPLVR